MRALFATVLLAVLAVGPAPAAAAQEPADDGLRYESATSFRLDPDAAVVRVTSDITVTNEQPDRGNQFFFFDEIWFPAQSEATNIRAERVGGDPLTARLEGTDNARWSLVTIELSPNLRYRATQEIRLTFDLPDLPPRSEGWTRANHAYATFSAYAVGDPGLADVTVVVPGSYGVETEGADLSEERADNMLTLRATDIARPDDWWVDVVARDDDLLEELPVTVGDHDVVLRAWPGDDAWASFVREQVEAGLPVLEELVGQPWPVDDELEIVETVTPYLYGYGGWYDTSSDVIEIGDELDAQLVLHELSHAWFNADLFGERWVTEGLAEVYSRRALAVIGGESDAPPALDTAHAGAQPLLSWGSAEIRDDDAEAVESYGYAASWWLMNQIAEEIGEDEMAEIIDVAAGRVFAYQGDPEPEGWYAGHSWQRTLDLFEEVGGSTEASELYTQYVVPPEHLPLLEERAQARDRYAELVSAGEQWTAPRQVREEMGNWDFAEATSLFDVAEQVLSGRDAAIDDLAVLGVDELPALEQSYETSVDVEAVVAEAAEYADVASTLADAAGDAADAGVLARFGLLGDDVEAELREAADVLAGGDVDAADEVSAQAAETLDGAALTGGTRYGMLAATLAGSWLIWRHRERRVGSARWLTVAASSSRSS